jgi:hypothetical protein
MADAPNIRAQLLISLDMSGTVTLQATSGDMITNMGMLEMAKVAMQEQRSKKNTSPIIGAKSLDPMLKNPPR